MNVPLGIRTSFMPMLLVDALRRSLQISEQVGIRAVVVDALDDTARNSYLKFGFCSLGCW